MKRKTFLLTMVATMAVFAAGLAAGYSLTRQLPATSGHAHGGADDHEDHPTDPEVVQLTEQSFKNLGVAFGKAEIEDYTTTVRIPARIIELPGYSDHRLAAPINGIVERLFVRAGQAITAGDKLFELQVIDEALLDAQLKLLDTITKLKVNAAEIGRLEPLADVRGRQLVDLKYQRQQLEATEQLYRQELLVRGLSSAQLDSIVDRQELVRRLTIRMPDRIHFEEAISADAAHDHEHSFTIEQLDAIPGTTVNRGDDLCHLAYHAALYIEGQAFERDLALLEQLHKENQSFTIEFGTGTVGHTLANAQIEYIDNRINDATQTYSFYAPIRNEIVSEQVVGEDVRFRTWRYKPGQRAHIVLPIKTLSGYLKLPAAAVVTEGPDAFVFRKYAMPHDHSDGHAHVHPYAEFKRTPVRLIYRDKKVALVKPDKLITDGQRIAVRNAFDLNLILKTNAGGSSSHHGHEH